MSKLYSVFFFIYVMLISTACFAQEGATTEGSGQMAVGMRSSGKIYVVVAVVVTILLGMIIYLVNLDKKISRLEKEIKS